MEKCRKDVVNVICMSLIHQVAENWRIVGGFCLFFYVKIKRKKHLFINVKVFDKKGVEMRWMSKKEI